ncbi:cupin domain-containing protein [Lachnospiraceae bacterium 62-35]
MIRTADMMGIKNYENMRGGKLTVHAAKFLEAEESYGCGSFFGRAVIPPGGSIGYHEHTGEFEIYYILEGNAKVIDDGTQYSLHAGDMMQCRDGSSHSIENIGQEDLVFLAMVLYNHEK